MTREQIEHLRNLAVKANAGPWFTTPGEKNSDGFYDRSVIAAVCRGQCIYAEDPRGVFPAANQEYIAAASPDVILGLLARLSVYENNNT
jgi:hypothetical protein